MRLGGQIGLLNLKLKSLILITPPQRWGGDVLVGRVGIEPTTGRLKAECSTAELTPQLESHKEMKKMPRR